MLAAETKEAMEAGLLSLRSDLREFERRLTESEGKHCGNWANVTRRILACAQRLDDLATEADREGARRAARAALGAAMVY